MLDSQLFAKLLESAIVKLPLVVGDQRVRYAEPADNGGPHKLSDLLFCDGG